MYTLAGYIFVPSVFWQNIPTAEFGMISVETACWATEKTAKFLMRIFTCRSTFLYGRNPSKKNADQTFLLSVWEQWQRV
jgi:hypothetical protein